MIHVIASDIQSHCTMRHNETDWHFSEKPIHLTGAVDAAAKNLETGWPLAQALHS